MIFSLEISLLIATIDGQIKKISAWQYILQFFPAVPKIFTF